MQLYIILTLSTHTLSPRESLHDIKKKLAVSEKELTEVKLERDKLKILAKELQTAVNAVQNALKGLSPRNINRKTANANKAVGMHSNSARTHSKVYSDTHLTHSRTRWHQEA